MNGPEDITRSVKASRRAAVIAAAIFFQSEINGEDDETAFRYLAENLTTWIETGVWRQEE